MKLSPSNSSSYVLDFETAKWMSCPRNVSIEYPGLAYVCPLEKIIVAERIDALHKVIGFNGIAYTIFNDVGQKVFLAVKRKRCKKFKIKIFNYYGNEVMIIKKPFKFCLNSVLVWAPPGNFVGSINKLRTCKNTFLVKNTTGKPVLKIRAQDNCNLVYDIFSEDVKVGMLTSTWQLLTVRTFAITFPVDMEFGNKAMLLGASFLIGALKCYK